MTDELSRQPDCQVSKLSKFHSKSCQIQYNNFKTYSVSIQLFFGLSNIFLTVLTYTTDKMSRQPACQTSKLSKIHSKSCQIQYNNFKTYSMGIQLFFGLSKIFLTTLTYMTDEMSRQSDCQVSKLSKFHSKSCQIQYNNYKTHSVSIQLFFGLSNIFLTALTYTTDELSRQSHCQVSKLSKLSKFNPKNSKILYNNFKTYSVGIQLFFGLSNIFLTTLTCTTDETSRQPACQASKLSKFRS